MVRVQHAAPERTEDYGRYVARAVPLFEVKSQSRCKCSLRSRSTNTAEEVYPCVARSVGFVSILLPTQFWAVDSKSSAQIQSPDSAHLPEDRRAVGIEPKLAPVGPRAGHFLAINVAASRAA
jgi:hypothetical protein